MLSLRLPTSCGMQWQGAHYLCYAVFQSANVVEITVNSTPEAVQCGGPGPYSKPGNFLSI